MSNNSLSLAAEPRHLEMSLRKSGGSHDGAPGCGATAVHKEGLLCLLPGSWGP